MKISEQLMKSKEYILKVVDEQNMGCDSIARRLYCNRCCRLIFGEGGLLNSDKWEDRCECERIFNPLEELDGYEYGCLFIWDENE